MVFHSRDSVNRELISYALSDDGKVNFSNLKFTKLD